ncbi:MAG: SMC-Scp complex subunit ScpB [Ignavibacteriae bacterium HGW-Ignavibacteriae-1]|nr:MAG: SMC-Scp complex subunit ScpB [Ignavibacteriae bacterium HGW-Ignavibacteriae-1]
MKESNEIKQVAPFLQLNYDEQKLALEAIIFSSEVPLNTATMRKLLVTDYLSSKKHNNDDEIDQVSINDEIAESMADDLYFENLIDEINSELDNSGRPFRIIKSGGGWLYSVKAEYGELINSVLKTKLRKRLSQASLEVLAIIAYKQPVSKPEIEQIRGVNSNEVVNSLIEKNLIKIAGRSEALGKPILYATTNDFLRTFGLNSLQELPKLKEIEEIASSDIHEPIESENEVEQDFNFNGFILPMDNELK